MKPKIYIAGAMTGLPNNNWDAFFDKEKQLEAAGWVVVNPARMDREKGMSPDSQTEYDYEDCARRDIEVLVTCNAIYMLSGFQYSKGACWERALAKHLNIKRYYEVPRADHEFPKDENNRYDNFYNNYINKNDIALLIKDYGTVKVYETNQKRTEGSD